MTYRLVGQFLSVLLLRMSRFLHGPNRPLSPAPTYHFPPNHPTNHLPPTTYHLPDPHAFVGRQVQLVAWLHVECGVPGIQVANGQRPKHIGGMAVDRDPLTQRRLAHLRRPRLRVGEEETLIASEPLDHRRVLSAK